MLHERILVLALESGNLPTDYSGIYDEDVLISSFRTLIISYLEIQKNFAEYDPSQEKIEHSNPTGQIATSVEEHEGKTDYVLPPLEDNETLKEIFDHLEQKGLTDFFTRQATREASEFGARISSYVKTKNYVQEAENSLFSYILENFQPDTGALQLAFEMGKTDCEAYLPTNVYWPTAIHHMIAEYLRSISKNAFSIGIREGLLAPNINKLVSDAVLICSNLVNSDVSIDKSIEITIDKIKNAIVSSPLSHENTFQSQLAKSEKISSLYLFDYSFLKSCGYQFSTSELDETSFIDLTPHKDDVSSTSLDPSKPSLDHLFGLYLISSKQQDGIVNVCLKTPHIDLSPTQFAEIQDFDTLERKFSSAHPDKSEQLKKQGVLALFIKQTIHEVQQTEARLAMIYVSMEKREEISHRLTDWILSKFDPELGEIGLPMTMGLHQQASQFKHDIAWPTPLHEWLANHLYLNSKVGYRIAKEEGSLQINVSEIVQTATSLAKSLLHEGVPYEGTINIVCAKMQDAILGKTQKSNSYYDWVNDLGSYFSKGFWEAYLTQAGIEEAIDAKMYNIGAGRFAHKLWTNIEYPNEYYSKNNVDIPWDAESDKPIPIESGESPAIFTSHTIEHLTTKGVTSLFSEALRLLKKGGILRVTCPNFDYYHNGYVTGDILRYSIPPVAGFPSGEDYLYAAFLGESVGQRSPISQRTLEIWNAANRDKKKVEAIEHPEFKKRVSENGIDSTMLGLSESISKDYHQDHLGSHINWWPTKRLLELGKQVGFSECYVSNYLQSRFFPMRDKRFFDTTHPGISQYVEFIK